ncbi:MAG: cysteine--tRNA ligase, partial [Candidatus Dormibacteraeota bacterium]|nr:cysteine--tRNA ligase [Candidatus Dormibacteraeota bacterium]
SELIHSDVPPGARAALLLDWDRVLGLDLGRAPSMEMGELPAGAAELLARRDQARVARDYETSDRLREELAEMGVVVTDSREGQKWKVATRV